MKVQLSKGLDISKLGRQLSAQPVVAKVQVGEERECLYLRGYSTR